MVQTLYKWWAGLMLVAVVLQVGFAGYGAFFVAGKLDGDGKTIDEDTYMDGFGIHSGFGYLVWLLGLVFLIIGVAAGIGKWRLGRHGALFGLLTLQVLLAWFGFEVAAIGFFHPVNALLIVGLSLWIVNDTWRAKAAVATPAAAPAS
jgi:hypothetical protein